MSTAVSRPTGVTIVGVVLFISAILDVIAGILAIVAANAGGTVESDGAALDPTGMIVLAVVLFIVAALKAVFAFGIMRGNRAARMIITILEVLSLIGAVIGMFTTAGQVWQSIIDIIVSIVVLALLWAGAQTKDFFAKR